MLFLVMIGILALCAFAQNGPHPRKLFNSFTDVDNYHGLSDDGGEADEVNVLKKQESLPVQYPDNGWNDLRLSSDPYSLPDGLEYHLHLDDSTGVFDRKWHYSRWLAKIITPGPCEENYKNCWHCSESPACKFCLLRFQQSGKLVVERGSSNTTDDYVGRCVSIKDPNWSKPIVIGYANANGRVLPPDFDRPPVGYTPVMAECHTILPDIDSSLTCLHADYTAKFPGFRDQLERLQQPVMRHRTLNLGEMYTGHLTGEDNKNEVLARWSLPTLQQLMEIELPDQVALPTFDDPYMLLRYYAAWAFTLAFSCSLLCAAILRLCGFRGLLCLPCRLCYCINYQLKRRASSTTAVAATMEAPEPITPLSLYTVNETPRTMMATGPAEMK